jgi:hypothetical protein
VQFYNQVSLPFNILPQESQKKDITHKKKDITHKKKDITHNMAFDIGTCENT